MTASLTAGIDVRDVTDVDRRTARRLGMSPETVNLVIATWAEEYIRYERENTSLSEKANGSRTTTAPAQRTRKSTPAKAAAKSPRKAAAKPAGTPDQGATGESATEAQTATMTTAEAEARAGDGK